MFSEIFKKKEEKKDTVDVKVVEENTINDTAISNPETIPLSYKELKSLKKARYEDKIKNNPAFKNYYLIKNKKTGQIVEIRAASSFHACNIVGWKANQTTLISERTIEESIEKI